MKKIGLVVAGALIFGVLMLVREQLSGIVLRALVAGIAAGVLCLMLLLAQREAGWPAAAADGTGRPHPNEQMLRDAYAAFGAGDMEGYLAHCTQSIVFHIPGHGHLAGDHSRDEFFVHVLPAVMQLSGGTFHETVQDVVAHDSRAAVLVTHEFERDGEPIRYESVHVYQIQDGLLADFTEYPQDLYVFDYAWRPAPEVVEGAPEGAEAPSETVDADTVVTPAV